jgi:hypothetical protein
MDNNSETHKTVWQLTKDLFYGLTFSKGVELLLPEVIHGFSVLFFGLLLAVSTFFVNRWLKKRFE